MELAQLLVKAITDVQHKYYFNVRQSHDIGRLYYLELKDIVNREVNKFKSNIPILTYNGVTYYNPSTIAIYGLYLWDEYLLTDKKEYINKFTKQAEWLLATQDEQGAWIHSVGVPRYSVKPGWRSAMAQGLAISLFIRAYNVTKQLKYRNAAVKAVETMAKPIEAGGCSSFNPQELPFLEELAVNPPVHILNGAIFALWGLYDLEMISDNYKSFKYRVIERLTQELPKFDLGYWSRYDLLSDAPATKGYHILHVSQMEVLDLLTGNPIFACYRTKWDNLLKNPYKRTKAFVKRGLFVLHHDLNW